MGERDFEVRLTADQRDKLNDEYPIPEADDPSKLDGILRARKKFAVENGWLQESTMKHPRAIFQALDFPGPELD